MKKALSIILSLLMLISTISVLPFEAFADELTSGQCGKNVFYEFNSDTGTLTISGTGDMDFSDDSPFKGNNDIKNVIISQGITSIGYWAFGNCTDLASVTIPDSVTSINRSAFYGCTSLTNITLPDSITSITDYAFYKTGYYNNSNNWENGALYIGNYLIKVKNSITGSFNIKNGTIMIANCAFSNCEALREITIPDTVRKIETQAFWCCTALKEITIPKSVNIIDSGAFENCSSLTDITILNPGCNIYNYDNLFGSDENDTIPSSAVIHAYNNSTAHIYAESFNNEFVSLGDWNCEENGHTYDGGLCYYCLAEEPDFNLSEADFEFIINDDDTITITDYNISNTWETSIKFLKIPSEINNYKVSGIDIGRSFADYNLLKIAFPETVKNLDSLPTAPLLELIYVDENNLYFDSRNNCNAIVETETNALIKGCKNTVIPDSVTSIGEYAFCNCESLTSIEIPNSVTSIGTYAFGNCESLTSITIPEKVSELSYNMFEGSGVNKVTVLNPNIRMVNNYADSYEERLVPATATIYGYDNSTAHEYALKYGRNFVSLGDYCEVQGHNYEDGYCTVCGKIDPDFPSIMLDELKTVEIKTQGQNALLMFVPEEDSEYTIYALSDKDTYAYLYDENMQELDSDDDSGYNQNFALTYSFEKGKIYFFGFKFWSGNTGEFNVRLVGSESESVAEEFSYTLLDDGTAEITDYFGIATKVRIPSFVDGYVVTQIGQIANSLSLVKTVVIPEGVTSIGWSAFNGCDNLTSITIPDSVTSIGDEAFAGCDNLASIVLPEGITRIGDATFLACKNLTSITIPDSVTHIGTFAFDNCFNLSDVYYTGSFSDWEKIGISSHNSYLENATIHYAKCEEHTWQDKEITENATCTKEGKKTVVCTVCGTTETQTIPKTDHTPAAAVKENEVKATYEKAGSYDEVIYCSVCGEELSRETKTIAKLKKTSLAKATVSGIKDKVYTGKALTQSVTVKLGSKTLKNGTDYKVTYKDNKSVGKATLKITGINAYSGTISKTFKINPKGTTISSITAKSKGFTVKWKKQTTKTTGYQIQLATDKNFKKNKKTVTVSKNSTVKTTVKKLTAKKKYYVRIRTYKTVSKTKYYSDWSASKTVTTKKS